MPQQIDPADIIAFHRLFAAGVPMLHIAQQTCRARNTVDKHLRGEYTYPPDLAHRVREIMSRTERQLNPTRKAPRGWITIAEAATRMPHRPTKYKAYTYVRDGYLRAEIVNGVTCTTPAWLQEFKRKYCRLPMRGLGCFRQESWLFLQEPPTARFWAHLRCRHVYPLENRPVAFAFDVRHAAERSGLTFLDADPHLARLASEAERRFQLVVPTVYGCFRPRPKASRAKPKLSVVEAARQRLAETLARRRAECSE